MLFEKPGGLGDVGLVELLVGGRNRDEFLDVPHPIHPFWSSATQDVERRSDEKIIAHPQKNRAC